MGEVRTAARLPGLVLAVGGLLASTGCGPVDITAPRLQAAVGPAFARLYVLQTALRGRPGLTTAWVDPAATCSRRESAGATSGAGDWTCAVVFRTSDGVGATAVYEVTARPGGCYTADGPASVVGPRTLSTPDGDVVNPLLRFDGCFDTT